MTTGTVLLGAGMALVALLVVTLNDKTKREPEVKNRKPRSPGSTLGLVLGIVLVGVTFSLGIAAPGLVWTIPVGIVGLLLVFLAISFRQIVWALLKAVLSGRFPHVITENADGGMEMKCPRCSFRVVVTRGKAGDTAFICPDCGEGATWTSDSTKS